MRILLSVLMLCCSIIGNASDVLTINVNASSPQFVVTLPSNPTTGYQWQITSYDKKRLKMISSQYTAPNTKLIGAGGNMTFTFVSKNKAYPSSTQMAFTYVRPWEPKSGSIKRVKVNFTK